MPTVAISASTSDNQVTSSSTTYSAARSALGTVTLQSATALSMNAGQRLSGSTYNCYQAYLQFATSSIGVSALVTSASLSVTAQGNNGESTGAFVVKQYSWPSSAVSTAFWTYGTALSNLTTAASRSGTFTTNSQYALAFLTSSVNQTGNTDVLCTSARFIAGTVPSGSAEYYSMYSADYGTTVPTLTVTYSASSAVTKPIFLSSAVARSAL